MQTNIPRLLVRQHSNMAICRFYTLNSKQTTLDETVNTSSKSSFASQTHKLKEDFKKAKADPKVKDWIESKPAISKFKESVEKERTRLFVIITIFLENHLSYLLSMKRV